LKKNAVLLLLLFTSVFGKPIGNDLDPFLAIGGRAGKAIPYTKYDFGLITQVRWDSSGNIYAFDPEDKCVHVFDSSGHFLRKMFSSGQGPEELSNPLDIAINPMNGNIYVLQDWGYSLKVFQRDGRLKKLLRLKKQIFSLGDFVDSERIVVPNSGSDPSKAFPSILLLDLNNGHMDMNIHPFDGVPGVNLDQRVCVWKGKVWTATKEHIEVREYDLETAKLATTFPVQGKFRKNSVVNFVKSGRRGYCTAMRTTLRPIVLNNQMWLLVSLRSIPDHPTAQDVTEALDKPIHYLYKLKNSKFQKVSELTKANGMRFLNADSKRNLLVFSSENSEFYLKFFKFNE
jgi:DNA-binding beta-propeller fold protein YncE